MTLRDRNTLFLSYTILFIAFVLLFSPAPAKALEITFKKNCKVDQSSIKLGDVAQFDEQTDLAKALATQQVGQSPPPGETIYLRSINIKQYIERHQTIPSDVYWQGSPTVGVFRNGVAIKPDTIQNLIANYLQDHKSSLPEADIHFIPKSLPLPFMIPVGSLESEIIPSSPAILGSSRFSIIFRVEGKVVKNMSVRGKLEAIANVVVTAKPVKRGHVLGREHLTVARTDISDLADVGGEIEDYVGMKLKRSLKAGSPLTPALVESLPVVHRGERVKIIVQSGAMLVTATGLAHSDGKQDQVIRVQNINSNKVVFCRVAAPGIVEVML